MLIVLYVWRLDCSLNYKKIIITFVLISHWFEMGQLSTDNFLFPKICNLNIFFFFFVDRHRCRPSVIFRIDWIRIVIDKHARSNPAYQNRRKTEKHAEQFKTKVSHVNRLLRVTNCVHGKRCVRSPENRCSNGP